MKKIYTQKLKDSNNLRIIPLGGCEEVGRNMTVFEYKKDIVILDMGLQFPEEDMPGIDYVIPNIEYLKGKDTCPQCLNMSIKRVASGIWSCKKCGLKIAGKAYRLK